MKIVFVIPLLSSVQAFFLPFLESLSLHGYDVHVFTNTKNHLRVFDWNDHIPSGVTIHHLDIPRFPFPWSVLGLAKAISKEIKGTKAMIHGHFLVGSITAAFVKKREKLIRMATLHSLVGDDFNVGIRLVIRFLEYIIVWKIDHLWVLNDTDSYRLRRFKNVSRLPGFGYGINEDRFLSPLSLEEISAVKQNMGIREDDLVLIYTGRIYPGKNIENLIIGFRQALKEHPMLTLIMCGEVDPAYKELKAQKHERIIYVGWQNDINKFLRISDCYINVSYREGMSVGAMEALFCGLPVICAPSKGIRELIIHGKTGYVCSGFGASDIKSGIEFFVENRNKISNTVDSKLLKRSAAVRIQNAEYQRIMGELFFINQKSQ